MMEYNALVILLNKYGINGELLIKNNPKVLEYVEYNNAEEIIIFLKDIGINPKNIEKCPSILFLKSVNEIRDVYNFLDKETKLRHIDIEDCLHILSSDLDSVRNIYNYVLDKYGLNTLINCPGILGGNYFNIVDITKTLEKTIGLDIVIDNGGSVLCKTTSEEIVKILTIPEFKYNKETKSYNKNLLTATTFKRTYEEIKDILNLKYWEEEEFKPLLTPSIWHKVANQIEDILNLKYWKEEKFKPLLTSSIWRKDASQIEDILNLKYWKEEKFKPLLTPSIWLKNAVQIETNIEICLNNGLEEFANNPTLIYKVSSNELLAKINYLKYINEPLYYENKSGKLVINSIFGMSNANMKKKYGISKKELVRDYLVIKENRNNVL